MNNGVKYGQKIPLMEIKEEKWQKKYAEISLLGSMLREQGISFVEFPINEKTEDEIILETARIFSDEGIFISLHPYFYQVLAPEIFDQSSSKICKLEKMLLTAHRVGDITKMPVTYVLHGGRANMEPYMISEQKAFFNAREFFATVDSLTTLKYTNVVPVCETQEPWSASSKGILRLGDTYNSCLELIEGTSVGVCWDFGHTYRAYYLRKHQMYPREHFLARVKHVHAHDTILSGDKYKDHYALGTGIAPWKEYCAELARHNYNDTVLLDVPTEKFNNLEELLHCVQKSVKMLEFIF